MILDFALSLSLTLGNMKAALFIVPTFTPFHSEDTFRLKTCPLFQFGEIFFYYFFDYFIFSWFTVLHVTSFSVTFFYSLDWSLDPVLVNVLCKMANSKYLGFICEAATLRILRGACIIREKSLLCLLPFACDGPCEVAGVLCSQRLDAGDTIWMKNKEPPSKERAR